MHYFVANNFSPRVVGKFLHRSIMSDINVSQNLSVVKEKIRNACINRDSGLGKGEPRLVAVSKTKPKHLIIDAYKCGQHHFGENYVQELLEKGFDEEIIAKCPEIKWHFIGHLQSNKVKKVVAIPNLFVVETIDSDKLASALDSAFQKRFASGDHKLNIFVQVNTSGEAEKSGCKPEDATKLVQYVRDNCPRLNVSGLMTIGQYDNYNSETGINPDFKSLADCHSKVCQELNIDPKEFELSMGMSGDFEQAIELGSTNVRVGSSIFGERLYQKQASNLN